MSYHSHRKPRPWSDLIFESGFFGTARYRRIKNTVTVELDVKKAPAHTMSIDCHEYLIGTLWAGFRPGETLYLPVGDPYVPPGQARIQVRTNGQIWCYATVCKGSIAFRAEN